MSTKELNDLHKYFWHSEFRFKVMAVFTTRSFRNNVVFVYDVFLLVISEAGHAREIIVNYSKVETSVAEPHHFYAAPGEKFDAALAAPAPAPAPTLLYSKAKFLK
jgi:hypothetical protein